jgi:type VI protein secretion system component VasK
MPLFRWTAPFASDVINPRIWIFWGLLTVLAFMAFCTWIWTMGRETEVYEEAKKAKRGEREEERKEERKEERDLEEGDPLKKE